MDDTMEETIELGFMDQHFDLEYEFDAARFFDFTRPESYSETQEAELWFEYAGSNPPSPFIIKLNWSKEIPVKNANTSQKAKDGETMNSTDNGSNISMGPEVPELDENNRGLKSHNHMAEDIAKAKAKSLLRSSLRSSTLMKPTASHLAKQNQCQEFYSGRFQRRFQKPFDENSARNPSVIKSQATKRQKLESGYLHKVAHLKHQTLFVHKVSKKVGHEDMNSVRIRPKVTIPREPDLETAHRAQRHRSKKVAESGEQTQLNARSFKARPLNRKILEAPSLPLLKKSIPQLPEFREFHLKTSERAMQHTMDNVVNMPNSSSLSQNGTTDFRTNSVDTLKQDKCETVHKFKAHPFNKKIFSSRGELGVFRNIKRDATIPMEFNFPTDKRFSYNPPIELFNKLSLTSNSQNNAVSQPKPPLHTKDSKENAPVSFNQEHGMINEVNSQRIWGKQDQCGSKWLIPEIGSQSNISRSLDIH